MKTFLCIAATLLASCAGTPQAPPTAPAASTPAGTHESTEDSDLTAADRRFAEETRGYKLVERNGRNYYCRSERASGSHLKSQICWSEAELRQRVESAEMYRRKNKPSVCAPKDPRCGGA